MARGFTQQLKINFTETTLPVVAVISLRALLAIATKWDMEIKQLDVESTFLYADLDKEIYSKQPKGFQVSGTNREKLVCKLCKAIYRFKQVGRVWWKLIYSKFKEKLYQRRMCIYLTYKEVFIFTSHI